MQFGLLGPLLTHDGTVARPVPASKQRIVLAALLLRAGEVVSADGLADAVWDEAPAGARKTLQTYIMRLRRSLGEAAGARIHSRPPGYLIAVSREELDLYRFSDLQEKARKDAERLEWRSAAESLREALALWRGQPLMDVPSAVLHREHGHRLAELRMAALQSRIDADLSLGLAQQSVAELRRLTGEYPLREGLQSRLMLALYRSGRQAEALEVFTRARRMLVNELGVEPGPELVRMHQRILSGDPELHPGERPMVHVLPAPFQLPADTVDFTGRGAQVAELTAHLGQGADADPPVAIISGPAGAGKTCLAVHVAHGLRATFPDGILFADLQGSGLGALDPAAALARFLRGLGVPGQAIPVHAEERTGLLRSLLATKRVLLVLDNAADAAQIRPLLPGGPGSAAMVTTRNRLVNLAGTHQVELGILDVDEARELLAKSAGVDRVSADPEGADTLVRACGALPLAVRIAGARLATRPHWSVRDLAHRLTERHRTLDELRIADLDVRASLALSYANLPSKQARALPVLSILQTPNLSADCAAALLRVPVAEAEQTLEELLDVNLLTEVSADRYAFHDLVRAFAREQPNPPADTVAGLRALLEHLTERLDAVMGAGLLRSTGTPRPSGPPPPNDWPTREHRTIVAAIEHVPTEPGLPAPLAAGLTQLLHRALVLTGDWEDLRRCAEATLSAAVRDQHPHSEVIAQRALATLAIHCQDLDGAATAIDRAQSLGAIVNDLAETATTLLFAGNVHAARRNTTAATAALSTALRMFEELSVPRGIIATSNYLGEQHTLAGDPRSAIGHLDRALELARSCGDVDFESMALQKLSAAHSALGQHDIAISYAEDGLRICRQRRSLHSQNIALIHLADCLAEASRFEQARATLEQAVALSEAIGDRRRAEQALKQLTALP